MGDTKDEHVIGFWCLNSSIIFKQISDAARSVILTSGTLSPLQTFAGELGTKFTYQLEALHVIEENQIWIGSIASGPRGTPMIGKYQNYEDRGYQTELGLSILRIINVIPKGVLVFMPSYSCLDKLMDAWSSSSIGIIDLISKKKTVFEGTFCLSEQCSFVEPRTGKTDFEKLMKDYEKAVREGDGAVLFCVQRGKV